MNARYLIPKLDAYGMHRTESNIKRSLFMCSMGHAPEADTARDFVERIKKEFPDATHNCWAFAAGPPADTARVGFSDDGEPHGTAGRPMLTALLHSGVGELVCVVTRYFGGVKLGTGGLVRAYQGAVLENLQSLETCERIIPAKLKIDLAYSFIDRFHRLLPLFEASIEEDLFTESAQFSIVLPIEKKEDFIKELTNMTDGSASISECEQEKN